MRPRWATPALFVIILGPAAYSVYQVFTQEI